MMGWYHDGAGWGGWVVMTLVMLGFWALVVFAVVAIFRGAAGPAVRTGAGRRDPLEILQDRFARGEIDAEEYEARPQVLRANERGPVA